jgi:RimJ/RimL family protein N-acetyltransferase
MFSAHFILSSATSQPRSLPDLLAHPQNVFGLLYLPGGQSIGAVAYLDQDELHARAEFRILIGEPDMRRHGYALEAAQAWLDFGFTTLNLEKIFVQIPEGDVRSLRLFEQLGFTIEAVLPDELRIGGGRQNAVRCGVLREAQMLEPAPPGTP